MTEHVSTLPRFLLYTYGGNAIGWQLIVGHIVGGPSHCVGNPAATTDDDLPLFCCIHIAHMQVVAAANQQRQVLVQQAQQLSASGGAAVDMSALTALRTSISKLAAVQQDDMSVSIKLMADKVAADPSYNVTADLATFTQVCVRKWSLAGQQLPCYQCSAAVHQMLILCAGLQRQQPEARMQQHTHSVPSLLPHAVGSTVAHMECISNHAAISDPMLLRLP